jgi:hypothetical protein
MDQTIPLSGGWILIRRVPGTQIKIKPLSLFYAMPGKVFVKGTHHIGSWLQPGFNYPEAALLSLYRLRRGSSALMESEIEAARALERRYADETDGEELKLDQRVRIETPDGTLYIEPHEWTPIADIDPYMEAVGDGYILHEYGVTAKITSRVEEQLFYMQSRGLPKADAMRLLAGSAKNPNLVWLEAEQEIIDHFFRRAA